MSPRQAVRSYDVAVIGAGPSGLMAARDAARRGFEVAVLERDEVVGGMAGSFEVEGLRVDFGSHRLHPSTDPDVLATLVSLLGDDLQSRPRHGRIRLEERWVAFPLRTGDLARQLPARFAAGAALDALTAPVRRPRSDTFDEVVRAGLGPTVADTFYVPYTTKIWGVPPSQLSGELARRRVSANSPGDVVRRLARGARPEGRTFFYPRRGFGQISEALADDAVAQGADLRLGDGVESITSSDDGVCLRATGGAEIEAGHVWSTMPATVLARLLGAEPPALGHRGLVLVYLVIDSPAYTTFDAHYFPSIDNPLSRLSEPKRYRDGGSDDPADRTVLCSEVPCSVGDDIWSAGDDDLAGLVEDALERDGLPRPATAAVEVRRLPRVYPLYRPGFERDLAMVEASVAEHPRVVTFGRQGLFVPDNTHHALAMGRAAASCLRRDGSFDTGAWSRARDGFRGHVVED